MKNFIKVGLISISIIITTQIKTYPHMIENNMTIPVTVTLDDIWSADKTKTIAPKSTDVIDSGPGVCVRAYHVNINGNIKTLPRTTDEGQCKLFGAKMGITENGNLVLLDG